jgi:hypothetical protein
MSTRVQMTARGADRLLWLLIVGVFKAMSATIADSCKGGRSCCTGGH